MQPKLAWSGAVRRIGARRELEPYPSIRRKACCGRTSSATEPVPDWSGLRNRRSWRFAAAYSDAVRP